MSFLWSYQEPRSRPRKLVSRGRVAFFGFRVEPVGTFVYLFGGGLSLWYARAVSASPRTLIWGIPEAWVAVMVLFGSAGEKKESDGLGNVGNVEWKDDSVEWRMKWRMGKRTKCIRERQWTWKKQETAEEEADRDPSDWDGMLYTLVDYIMASRRARVYCRLCPICPAG